jgi:hypothetical protein
MAGKEEFMEKEKERDVRHFGGIKEAGGEKGRRKERIGGMEGELENSREGKKEG